MVDSSYIDNKEYIINAQQIDDRIISDCKLIDNTEANDVASRDQIIDGQQTILYMVDS